MRGVFLAAGVGLFVFLVVRLGPGSILEMVGRIGWNAPAIAGIYALHQALRAQALSDSVTGRRLRWRDALAIRLSGESVQFLTITGPFLAEPAKAWLLTRRGLSTVEGFAATLTEFFIYTFVAACVSIAAIGWLLTHQTLHGAVRDGAVGLMAAMILFLAAATWAIARRYYLLGTILEGLSRAPGLRRRLHPDMPGVHRVEDLLLGTLRDRPRRFAWISAVEAGSHAVLLFELYWIMRTLHLSAGIGTAFLVDGATKFIELGFFFIPGQIGASEAAHTAVFEILGLPAAAGFAVPFVRRIRSAAVAGVGLLAMSVLMRRSAARDP